MKEKGVAAKRAPKSPRPSRLSIALGPVLSSFCFSFFLLAISRYLHCLIYPFIRTPISRLSLLASRTLPFRERSVPAHTRRFFRMPQALKVKGATRVPGRAFIYHLSFDIFHLAIADPHQLSAKKSSLAM